jgi:hypothetical protein
MCACKETDVRESSNVSIFAGGESRVVAKKRATRSSFKTPFPRCLNALSLTIASLYSSKRRALSCGKSAYTFVTFIWIILFCIWCKLLTFTPISVFHSYRNVRKVMVTVQTIGLEMLTDLHVFTALLRLRKHGSVMRSLIMHESAAL